MKIKDILKLASNRLKEPFLDNSDFEAEVLLSAAIKKNREYLISHLEENLSFWQIVKTIRLINKRLAGHSSAVLTGHKWFYGLDFIVNKNVLVPRPETELMVEKAIDIINNGSIDIKNIVDVGTGSGCIIVSLAKILKNKDVDFYGLDVSKKALVLAKKNAKINGVESCIHFLYSDLLNTIDKNIFNEPVIITANLPYLTPEQVENSPSIKKEPKLALLAGRDGLDLYRKLFKQIKEILAKKELVVLCEIDDVQGVIFSELAQQCFPDGSLVIMKDLSGQDRLGVITI